MNNSLTNATTAQQPLNNVLSGSRLDDSGQQKVAVQTIGGLRPESLFQQFGFLENPFGVTPNPRYLYQSRTHAEASSSLIVGIECGVGFQALIAPPGMGKTTILFNILEQFENVASTAFLFQSQADSRDLLRNFISELGGDAPDSDLVRMHDTINQLLVSEHQEGRRTILIIDEAQNLEPSVLETVRLLSNFETPSEKLLQIILAGQPQLAHRLASAEVAQLSQRISILTTLVPLDLEDTTKYIEHRLKIAGYRGRPLFTAEALKFIWESSSGIPREINKLCFNALLLARAVKQMQVDLHILREVVTDLNLDCICFNGCTSSTGIRGVQIGQSQMESKKTGPDGDGDASCKSELLDVAGQSDNAATRVLELPASSSRRETDVVASPIAGQGESLSSENPVEITAGLLSDAIEHDSQARRGKPTAAERAVMLEAIETLMPELERLIGGAEASQPKAARPSPDINAEPAENTSATHDAEAICRCGSSFEEGEKFCGKCGTAHFKELCQGTQSKLASNWYLQQAQSVQAGNSCDHTKGEEITPLAERPVPLEEIIARLSPPVTDTTPAKSADARTQQPDQGAQASEIKSEIRPDASNVGVPRASETNSRVTSEFEAETVMQSEPVAAPRKSEPTGTPNAATAKIETAEFEAITGETEALHGIPEVPAHVPARIEAGATSTSESTSGVTADLKSEQDSAPKSRVDSELKADLDVNPEPRPEQDPAARVQPETQVGAESDAKTELKTDGPAIVPSQAQTEPQAEAKRDLDLHSSVGTELPLKAENEPDSAPKVGSDSEAKPGQGSELGTPEQQKPEVDPGSDLNTGIDRWAKAVAGLRILPIGDLDGTALSRSLSPTEAAALVRELWDTHKASVYLGASILILLVALLGWRAPSVPKGQPLVPQVTVFLEELQAALGTAKLPPGPIYQGNPNARVWVDVQSALYYCPGARLYGKTKAGRFTRQQDAQQEQFEPADNKACP